MLRAFTAICYLYKWQQDSQWAWNNKINGLESKNLMYELSKFCRLADSQSSLSMSVMGYEGYEATRRTPTGARWEQKSSRKTRQLVNPHHLLQEGKFISNEKLLWTSVKQIVFTQTASTKNKCNNEKAKQQNLSSSSTWQLNHFILNSGFMAH